MHIQYANGCILVNAFGCLHQNNGSCINKNMTLGKRLKAAREYAKLETQEMLAKKSHISQQTISKIERDLVETSGYVVQLAVACGVRPEWLAMEEGEMADGLYVENEQIKKGVMILEQLQAEYRLDDALNLLTSIAQFSTKKAAEDKK